MSPKPVPPLEGAKVKPFGPNNELLYTISEARSGESRIGAILWGLGIAEMKTARTLAKKGIVSLQMRINGKEFYDDAQRNEIYRTSGVDYCGVAMDKLGAERGVTSFILMGNCACANLCLHAAVHDPRVVGLILTNPYIAKAQLLRTLPLRKLRQAAAWKRLRTDGHARARAGLRRLPRLIASCLGLGKSAEGNRRRAAPRPPIELPEKLGHALRALCDRGLKVLVACTASDDSFHYLSRRYGKELRELEAHGNLRFASIASAAHVFSQDDDAAGLLNDAITDWIRTTTLTAPSVAASTAYRLSGARQSFAHT